MKLSIKNCIIVLVTLGFLVFGRMLFNGFVGDDTGYIRHLYIQQFEFAKFFQSSSADLGGTSQTTGQFYRPIMLVVLSALYSLFGPNAFFFHFLQLLFHIANSVLVFLVLLKFSKRGAAFFASLLFLVHPIQVEAVAYISDFQDILFLFFGLLAFATLLYEFQKKYLIVTIPALLLLSLLSKETGVLFFPLLLFYIYHNKKSELAKFAFSFSFIAMIYVLTRTGIGGITFGKVHDTVFGEMSTIERISHIPSIFVYYAKTLLLPINLAIGQTWTTTNYIASTVAFVLLMAGIFFLLSKKSFKAGGNNRFTYSFFALWLLLGFIFHSQIIPLEMTVADRWFYFPFVGMLGTLALLLTEISKKNSKLILFIGILIISILSIRTVIRLADWKDAITLYAHDTTVTRSYLLEHSYGYELMQQNKFTEALPHLLLSYNIFPNTNNTNTLGVYYYKIKEFPQAISYFKESIKEGDNFLAYNNISQLYLEQKDYKLASQALQQTVSKFPNQQELWFKLALVEYQLNNLEKALDAAENAYALSQSQQNYYVVTQLRSGLPIKIND